MKIAVTSDFHIGNTSDSFLTKDNLLSKVSETFKQIDSIIDYCVDKKINELFILGDIFHTQRPINKYLRLFIERLNRLENSEITTTIILGNHESNLLGESALSPLKKINYKNNAFN